METTTQPEILHKSATEALENIGRMADEMENTYKEKIEILELIRDEAIATLEKYMDENKELRQHMAELFTEEQDERRSFTVLQLAVSMLIFVYGMIYGSYLGKCA